MVIHVMKAICFLAMLLVIAADVRAATPLRLTIVEQVKQRGECGDFRFAVGCRIDNQDSGYIIEWLQPGSYVTDCKGIRIDNPINPNGRLFWLAWRVDHGAVYEGFSNRPHYAQVFRTRSEGVNTKGSAIMGGGVAFIKNYALDPLQWQQTNSPVAGNIPWRTDTPPGTGNVTDGQLIGLDARWSWCGTEKWSIPDTEPVSGTFGNRWWQLVQPEECLCDRVLDRLPSPSGFPSEWGIVRDALVARTSLLSGVGTESVRLQLVRYLKRHASDREAIAKVRLLSRLLFALPESYNSAPVARVPQWREAGTVGSRGRLLWPTFLWDEQRTGVEEGASGDGWEEDDCLSEFDYFAQKFRRRMK